METIMDNYLLVIYLTYFIVGGVCVWFWSRQGANPLK